VGASILARFKLSPRQFVLGVKVFEMQVSALRASNDLGVAYRTAWKLFTVLRQALAKAEHGQELLVGGVEGEESSLTHFKTAVKSAPHISFWQY
jgi:molybdenum-dependent DNA-binding transcriptional regulator ModE